MGIRILLATADGRIHKLKCGPLEISFRESPLTLTTLAALVPPQLGAHIEIADESVQRIPFHKHYDLVGVSCITGTSTRAYQIADHFRAKGSTVVMGGVHVALRADEAAEHADAIVIGTAEKVWPELLSDFCSGALRKRYDAPPCTLAGLPHPRRDLQKRFGYMSPNVVMATRGCKNVCDFCTINGASYGWHMRPVGEVVDEIRAIRSRRFVFNDVSLLEDRDYALELFSAIAPLRKIWGGLCTTRVGHDQEMLDLMHRSGCVYLLLGFESVSKRALYEIRKGFNQSAEYPELMRKLHDRNITVQGCFIFGFDDDSPTVFQETVEAVQSLKIDIPRYAIYTPYPGTVLYDRLKSEGRILHEDWRYYDTQHVVFQPKQMSPEQLDDGFRWAWRTTFSIGSILPRTFRHSKYFPITFLGNLGYRLYIRRLAAEQNRILYPVCSATAAA